MAAKRSKYFELVKAYYESGKWDIEKVRKAVTAPVPWITKKEFTEITGETF